MIDIARLKMIQGRLADAIRRHGLATVVKVVSAAFFRYGLLATVRLGGAERPFPWQRSQGVQATALVAGTSGPADLDQAFTIDRRSWESWRKTFDVDEDLGDRSSETVKLTFVIQTRGLAPGALQRTRTAIAAMGETAKIWPKGPPPGPDGFWVFVQAGDLPSPDMPQAFARAARGGVAEVISFDLSREAGDRIQPLLLPGANPTLLQAVDYMFSRAAVAPAVLPAGADPSTAQPRELILDWIKGQPAQTARGRWRHVARPLLLAALPDDAVEQARRGAVAGNRRPLGPNTCDPISVIICTRDKGHLTRQLVRRLIDEAPSLMGDLVIVSNNTTNPYALSTLEDLARSPRVQVLHRDEPFNFSRLCNAGSRVSKGRGPLLFLNDDITPVSEDWLHRLAVRLDDPDVGAAGPLLLYPDERVQHAGMYLGKRGDAGHVLRGARLPDDDYLFTGCAPREVSALTGAALLTPRAAFEALNGFDEQLATHLQDVDYCLRLTRIGLLNIFEPASVLIHMESASIRSIDAGSEFQRLRLAERLRFRERWGEALTSDPLHPRGFDIEDETLRRLSGAGSLRAPSLQTRFGAKRSRQP